jgi:cell division protein FtsQ
MIWRIIKIILILLLPAYLIAAYVYAQYEYDKEVCNNIKVVLLNPEEEQYLSQDDILKVISDENLACIGQILDKINLNDIENSIQRNTIIKNNECYKTPSGTIVIEVEQRVPVLRVITPLTSYYIDKDRKKLPLSEKILAYVPVATGAINEEFAAYQLFDLVQYLNVNKKWDNQIEQIVVKENEEVELIPRMGKQLILFGKLNNFEEKFNSIELLYSQVFNKVGWNYYNKINLRYDGKIICTKNQ